MCESRPKQSRVLESIAHLSIYLVSQITLGSCDLCSLVRWNLIAGVVVVPFLLRMIGIRNHFGGCFNSHVPIRSLPISRLVVLDESSSDHRFTHVCDTLFAQRMLDGIAAVLPRAFAMQKFEALRIPQATAQN